jgi:transcriptional regulator with XRE-family HTH domain
MPAARSFKTALGAAVKARREELGLTQEQIANDTELHQRWISNVETGKRNPIHARELSHDLFDESERALLVALMSG